MRTAPDALGNIRTDAVGGPDNLLPHRVTREGLPRVHDIPDHVSNRFGEPIDIEFFKIRFGHGVWLPLIPYCCPNRHPTNNKRQTNNYFLMFAPHILAAFSFKFP